jgi:transketolase
MTVHAPAPSKLRTLPSHLEMANAVRFLAADAVERAKSGHPGMPMGMADVATVLFSRFLKFDAADPRWPDRDRLVLSAGHGSMLLYALLHLTGYETMTLDELKRFRQWGSKTPGHPEYGHTEGVETTTGPLGQGLATAVGMALAERMLNARFSDDLVDHFTYVIAGDGCLMEGISHEAISLAGHLNLSRLIVLFDDNHITIDGAASLSCSDDQMIRFLASGWSVRRVDGHDHDAIAQAISEERETNRPSLIACRTVIGYGAPTRQGTEKVHGAPLGSDELARARETLQWTHAPFEIPEELLARWRAVGTRGRIARHRWMERLEQRDEFERESFEDALAGEPGSDAGFALREIEAAFADTQPTIATRQASQQVLEAITQGPSNLLGGSADLTHSNLTLTRSQQPVRPGAFAGNYIHYGIREHAMAAAMNGIALHGGFVPYGGTFLAFSDYSRPAIRLAALMGVRVIHVMTHDSIGLGEDGPTHQPVEHLAALRAIPNLLVFRPADAIETAQAWDCALREMRRPSVLCLSRQALPTQPRIFAAENLVARGAYVLIEPSERRDVTLIATGSEVAIATDAATLLAARGLHAAVVSAPCFELFERQPANYRAAVLGSAPRVGIEAAIEGAWRRWLGEAGEFIGMTGFGASAPAGELYSQFGISAESVATAAERVITRTRPVEARVPA